MRRLLFAVSSIVGVACGRSPSRPPAAEFLVTTADSTFWIRADSTGIRLRAAPLRLAEVDGRFVELYVADDDRSFQDAVFITQRIYSRDLITGDSTVVWRESRVLGAAVSWGQLHPDAVPLGPDDEEDQRPRRRHVVDVALLSVHDRWLSIRTHEDIESEREPLVHLTRRSVVNLATGDTATLTGLFGPEQTVHILAEGERQLALARDSADRLPALQRDAARTSVRSLALNESRFALDVADGRPGAELMAGSELFTAGDPTLVLRTVTVPSATWWTPDEKARHPDTTQVPANGAALSRWRRGRYELVAHADTGNGPTMLALRDTAAREFPVTAVAGAVESIVWLDRPALAADARAALVRAFSDAAYYSDEVRTARWVPRASRPILRSTHDRYRPHAPSGARIAPRDVAAHDADRREQPRPRLRRGDPEHDRHDRGDLRHAARARDVRDGQH
jgi:hypothetical protein